MHCEQEHLGPRCCSYSSALVISLALIQRCSAALCSLFAETGANSDRQMGQSSLSKDTGSRNKALLQVAATATELLWGSNEWDCVLFVRDGSIPTGAWMSSHTGLHCAYQLVIRRRVLWDLELIQQGCPASDHTLLLQGVKLYSN